VLNYHCVDITLTWPVMPVIKAFLRSWESPLGACIAIVWERRELLSDSSR